MLFQTFFCTLSIALSIAVLVFAGCGNNLEQSLNTMGVDTEETPRTYTVDEDGDGTGRQVELPDDYSPLQHGNGTTIVHSRVSTVTEASPFELLRPQISTATGLMKSLWPT